MGILTAFLLVLGIIKQVFKGRSFFALDEKCYNPDFSTFCTSHQVQLRCASRSAKGSMVSESFLFPDCQGLTAAQERRDRWPVGTKVEQGAISRCCLSCLCSQRLRKTRRAMALRNGHSRCLLCTRRLWECPGSSFCSTVCMGPPGHQA